MAKRQTKNKRKRSVLAPSPPQMVILRVCMVLLALLLDEGGLIPQLLGNMGLTVPSFTAAAKAEVIARNGGKYSCPLPDSVQPPLDTY